MFCISKDKIRYLKLKCTQKGWPAIKPTLLVVAYFRRFIRSNGEYLWCCIVGIKDFFSKKSSECFKCGLPIW